MGFSPNDRRLTKSSNQIEVTGESNPCNGLLEHAFTDRQVREGYSFPLRGLSLSKAKFYSSLFEEGNDIFQQPMDPEIIMAIIFEEARSPCKSDLKAPGISPQLPRGFSPWHRCKK